MNIEGQELSEAELEQVSGGFAQLFVAIAVGVLTVLGTAVAAEPSHGGYNPGPSKTKLV